MIRRPPRSTLSSSSAASDVYKRQPFTFFNKSGARPSSLIMNLLLTGAVSVSLWVFITKMILLLLFPQENNYQQYWDITFPYRIGIGVILYAMIILTYFLFE